MNTFKVTYTDGTHYTTNANGTLSEFTAYLMQCGGIVTTENPATGEETRRYIDKIEEAKNTMYKIQVFVKDAQGKGTWKDLHPTNGPAYIFTTKQEAESMRKMCYPEHPDTTRVIEE